MRNQLIKGFYLLITLLATNIGFAQELYSTTSAQIDFFSEAPIEDIKAESKNAISVLNLETGELAFQVMINTFQFEKALMQEHFNENYMEAEKHPKATFKGTIYNLKLTALGIQEVLLKGNLKVHGVSRYVEIPASFQKNDGVVTLETTFDVKCEEYKIKIPKLLWKNIAETIQVHLKANYQKTR